MQEYLLYAAAIAVMVFHLLYRRYRVKPRFTQARKGAAEELEFEFEGEGWFQGDRWFTRR